MFVEAAITILITNPQHCCDGPEQRDPHVAIISNAIVFRPAARANLEQLRCAKG